MTAEVARKARRVDAAAAADDDDVVVDDVVDAASTTAMDVDDGSLTPNTNN